MHATAAAAQPHVTVRSGCKPAASLLLHLGSFEKKSQPDHGSGGRNGELRPSHEQDPQVWDTQEAMADMYGHSQGQPQRGMNTKVLCYRNSGNRLYLITCTRNTIVIQ